MLSNISSKVGITCFLLIISLSAASVSSTTEFSSMPQRQATLLGIRNQILLPHFLSFISMTIAYLNYTSYNYYLF